MNTRHLVSSITILAAVVFGTIGGCAPAKHTATPQSTAIAMPGVTPTPKPTIAPTLAPTPSPTPSPSPTAKHSPWPPFGVGAFVNPVQPTGMPNTFAALVTAVRHPLTYELFYVSSTSSLARVLAQAAADNAIPILSVKGGIEADLLSGADDGGIATASAQIVAYGKPVVIRYLWEMNAAYQNLPASDFLTMWSYYFTRMNAPNVIRFWCAAGADWRTMEAYYPVAGPLSTWDGFDAYDRTGAGFIAAVQGAYAVASLHGKPLYIGETNALPSLNQGSYFPSPATIKTIFPNVIGFDLFDSIGPKYDWELTPAGLAAFKTFVGSL